MIRFEPDTWIDFLMRPFAMVAPDSNVYVEIGAPDLRFAFSILLGVVLLIALRPRVVRSSPTLALGVWTVVIFIIWMLTSGNGRYFIPGLLVIGPLCIALAYRMPGTRGLRACVALLMVGLQLFAVVAVSPWQSWGWAQWRDESYFPVTLDEQARTKPATYVGVSNISYSLIAPQFPQQSHWINTSSLPDASDIASPEVRRAQALLKASSDIQLLVPSRPDFMAADGNPTPALADEVDKMLNGQRLAVRRPLACRLLPSRGLLAIGLGLTELDKAPDRLKATVGFWVCPLQYPVARLPQQKEKFPEIAQVFAAVEKQCPRFFAPGQTDVVKSEDGWVRFYPQSDMRLYVRDDGRVYYKYFRSLNMVLLGESAAVRSGASVDCATIRGRSGMPWQREI